MPINHSHLCSYIHQGNWRGMGALSWAGCQKVMVLQEETGGGGDWENILRPWSDLLIHHHKKVCATFCSQALKDTDPSKKMVISSYLFGTQFAAMSSFKAKGKKCFGRTYVTIPTTRTDFVLPGVPVQEGSEGMRAVEGNSRAIVWQGFLGKIYLESV